MIKTKKEKHKEFLTMALISNVRNFMITNTKQQLKLLKKGHTLIHNTKLLKVEDMKIIAFEAINFTLLFSFLCGPW